MMIHDADYLTYFDISGSLNSPHFHQVSDALTSLHSALPRLTSSRPLVNSVILRLVKIFSETNLFYFKTKVHSILTSPELPASLLGELPNKQQIISQLTSQLHATDNLTRIIVLMTLKKIPDLFKTELTTYHLLLTKLIKYSEQRNSNPLPQLEYQQKQLIFQALKSILRCSSYLSNILAQHILSSNLNQTPEHSRLLCIYLRLIVGLPFTPQKHHLVITHLSRRSLPKIQLHPRIAQLVLDCLGRSLNAPVAKLYLSELKEAISFKTQTTKMQIQELIRSHYPYLTTDQSNSHQSMAIQQDHKQPTFSILQPLKDNIIEYLDYLYSIKHSSSSLLPHSQIQDIVSSRMRNFFESGTMIDSETMLLLYYSRTTWDTQLAANDIIFPSFKNFKILLTLRYPFAALKIFSALLDRPTISTKAYLRLCFYKAVCLFYSSPSLQSMQDIVDLADYESENILAHSYSQYFSEVFKFLSPEHTASPGEQILQRIAEKSKLFSESVRNIEGNQCQLKKHKRRTDILQGILQWLLLIRSHSISDLGLVGEAYQVYNRMVPEHLASSENIVKKYIYFPKEVFVSSPA